MSPRNTLEKELLVAERLVREAGALVRQYFRQETDVAWKGRNDPVTAADHFANAHLVEGLRREFPDDGILAEESADDLSRLSRRRVWMIDPLDGTKEFISGIEEFSVMVGLAVGSVPALGVVYQPVADLLYRGVPGVLAQLANGAQEVRPLAVSSLDDPADMRLVVSRSHRDPLVGAVGTRLGISKEKPSGSVGLKVGLLATSDCDLYIHPAPGLKEWDTCAPEAILVAAGGALSDAWGRALSYNKQDVRQRYGLVATNGRHHERIVSAVSAAAEATGYTSDSGFW